MKKISYKKVLTPSISISTSNSSYSYTDIENDKSNQSQDSTKNISIVKINENDYNDSLQKVEQQSIELINGIEKSNSRQKTKPIGHPKSDKPPKNLTIFENPSVIDDIISFNILDLDSKFFNDGIFNFDLISQVIL